MLTISQVRHRTRWASQQVFRPEIAVIGGYHCGNLGDMALGESCRRRLVHHGIRTGLQTIYGLYRWPTSTHALLGGGAIAYSGSLGQVARRYERSPERVAAVGVDFNDDKALSTHASFLKNLSFISCRSEQQALRLRDVLDRSDIIAHPDLVFGFYEGGGIESTAFDPLEGQKPVLGVNCTNFFWKRSGTTFQAGSDWESEIAEQRPDLLPWINDLGKLYVDAFRLAIRKARENGFNIQHVPFTPTDDQFARAFFSDEIDVFHRYTSRPEKCLRRFKAFNEFLPTRFHSMVFALITQTPMIPFCYASKSERLLGSIGLDDIPTIDAMSLVHGGVQCVTSYGPGIVAPLANLSAAKSKVEDAIDTIVSEWGCVASNGLVN